MLLIDSDSIAKERLERILSDKLLRFNPYSVDDTTLLGCANRGTWLPWPSITQMVIFHFHEIRYIPKGITYEGLFFNIGNSSELYHYGTGTFSQPMLHLASRQHVWMLLNGKHLTPSLLKRLERKKVFVSHALRCRTIYGKSYPSYRMNILSGSTHRQASTIRKVMIQSKITMLEEVLNHPSHPEYLAYSGHTFDYRSPILSAISNIRQYPDYPLQGTRIETPYPDSTL